MATVEQLTIQFEGKGAPALTGQLNSLSAAMNRLAARQVEATKATRGASKATDSYNERLTKNGRNVEGLQRIFGTFGKRMSQMRSQLLIVAFAVGMVTKAIQSLTDAFADYAKLNAKINAVLKSTSMAAGKTSKALDNMANSLEKSMGVSSTQIKEIQVRLLTFTDIVGTVFDKAVISTLDLAAVIGQDAKQAAIQLGKALNDPVKGYTALKRVGVSFSDTQIELIKQFQEQGNIMQSQLVILEAIEGQLGGAAEAQKDAAIGTERWRMVMANLGEVMRDWGELLQPIIFGIAELVDAFVGLIGVIPRVVLGFVDLVVEAKEFITGMQGVKEALQIESAMLSQWKTMEGNLEGLKDNIDGVNMNFRKGTELQKEWTDPDELLNMSDKITQLTKNARAWNDNQKQADKLQEEYNTKIQKNNQLISQSKKNQDIFTKSLDKNFKALVMKDKLLKEELSLGRELTEMERMKITLNRELTDSEKIYAEAIEDSTQKLKEQKEAEEGKLAIKEQSIEFAGFLANSFLQSSNIQMQAVKDQQNFELQQLRNQRSYQKASDSQKKKMEKEIMDRNAKDMAKAFNRNKNARYAQAIIDTYSGITRALGDHAFPASAIISSMIGAMGLANVTAIKATEAPKFAYGGLVGGQPHSQGGTMIEAERGEFVVRKAAVDALGIETLNRLNTGQGGGSVNISFSGNILSKDFLEDEAIPQIKEALRRGGDIGVG